MAYLVIISLGFPYSEHKDVIYTLFFCRWKAILNFLLARKALEMFCHILVRNTGVSFTDYIPVNVQFVSLIWCLDIKTKWFQETWRSLTFQTAFRLNEWISDETFRTLVRWLLNKFALF